METKDKKASDGKTSFDIYQMPECPIKCHVQEIIDIMQGEQPEGETTVLEKIQNYLKKINK